MEPDERLKQPEEARSETPATAEGGAAEGGPPGTTPPELGGAEGDLPSEQQPRRRRRGLTLVVAGVVVLVMVGIAAFFALSRGEKSRNPASPDAGEGAAAPAGDTLAEFFVPLPGKEVLVRVSFTVKWREERRIAFLQEQVAIQDEVYQKLYDMTATGMIPRQGSALQEDFRRQVEQEVTRIFARFLGAQDFKVLIQDVLFVPASETKAMPEPEPGHRVEDASAPP